MSLPIALTSLPHSPLVALLFAAITGTAAAQTIAIPSPSFDFVQRVNYGTSQVFEANAESFSAYAVGDNNSAQQTWFRVKDAVAKAAAGREIRSATLTFRSGSEDNAARTLYLARTSLGVTPAVNRRTSDGSNA